jgi:hypothetical protein
LLSDRLPNQLGIQFRTLQLPFCDNPIPNLKTVNGNLGVDIVVTGRTAAVFYVADQGAMPSLAEVVEVAHGQGPEAPVRVAQIRQVP